MRQFLPLTALALFGLCYSATAQVQVKLEPLGPLKLSYGIRGGAQVTRTTSTAPGYQNVQPMYNFWGGQGGLVLDAALGWLSLQPAVVFVQKGFRVKEEGTVQLQGTTYTDNSLVRLRLNYLEVPVNLVATVHGVQLFAGPYLGVGLNGRYHYEFDKPVRTSEYYQTYAQAQFEQDEKVGFGKENKDAYNTYFRRLDAGYTVGLGYKTGPLQVQLSHSHGLRNSYQSPYIGFDPDTKTRGFQLNLTYFFSPAS
ncbi:outer membrane beta-barrel protein [Hymenobacter sp. UYP22]|uniref:outer membrane beta-barrel protein n=1 Tax=Hymenobacter sp. UYP22 TaxID=3156348 RepID=UPI003397DB0F